MNRHLAVIFGDWHVHIYKQFNADGQRLAHCIKVLHDIGGFCNKNGITTVFFVGDLYDQMKNLPTEVVNALVAAFLKFFEENPDIIIYGISGNHDYATKNLYGSRAVSALDHIASIFPNNFIVVDNEAVKVDEDITVFGIPYYEYPEHFDKALSDIVTTSEGYDYDGFKYLMIHQTPKGIGNTMIPYDTNPEDERYDAFDYVFCGHIHSRMDLTSKFSLVGNPIHRDLADAGKKKGFLVMNLRKPENGYKFIPLVGYPEFVEIEEGEIVEGENNYVVERPSMDAIEMAGNARVEDFNTNLKAEELLVNYCKEVGETDEELLAIGIGFLK